jgi:arylsulfatase A-like enzyme
VALSGCGSGGLTPPLTTTDQVLLICWDGARRGHVKEMLAAGRLPNLQQLVNDGGYAETDITDHPTETFTAHAEMLTGYPPGDLGVTTPESFAAIPHELTLIDRLEQHFGPQDFTSIWVSSKKARIPAWPGQLWSDTKPQADLWDGDVDRAHTDTGPCAVGYLQQYARPGVRFFVFVHFRESDNWGHNFGEESPEYEAALVSVDGWLGQLRATLNEQAVGATTAVLVVTDHGFDKGQRHHKRAPDAWLATNWGRLRDGNQQGLTPTILTLYGIDPSTYDPPLPGRSLWAAR